MTEEYYQPIMDALLDAYMTGTEREVIDRIHSDGFKAGVEVLREQVDIMLYTGLDEVSIDGLAYIRIDDARIGLGKIANTAKPKEAIE